MISKRAFTLVELLFTTAITAIIVGALASMFVFVSTKAARSMAQNGVLVQVQALSDELDSTFSQAQGCQQRTLGAGIQVIKCVVPSTGADLDGDGKIDRYNNDRVGPTGKEGYTRGLRVWYYMSDSSGNPANAMAAGGLMFKAWRNDDSNPTTADLDTKFSFYYNNTSNPRWNFIDSVQFTVNADGTVTYRIAASKLFRGERRAEGTDASSAKSTLVVTRKVMCKNWRK